MKKAPENVYYNKFLETITSALHEICNRSFCNLTRIPVNWKSLFLCRMGPTKHKWLHKSNTYKTSSIYITNHALMKHTIYGVLIKINHWNKCISKWHIENMMRIQYQQLSFYFHLCTKFFRYTIGFYYLSIIFSNCNICFYYKPCYQFVERKCNVDVMIWRTPS